MSGIIHITRPGLLPENSDRSIPAVQAQMHCFNMKMRNDGVFGITVEFKRGQKVMRGNDLQVLILEDLFRFF